MTAGFVTIVLLSKNKIDHENSDPEISLSEKKDARKAWVEGSHLK